ncbi:uncharacterized protein METZ01_LOCUS232082 [marine metagenome]|uniref:Uncharacterized protein n=1 Tax=marine metagenome TaxID=408172 RepID=A0A382GVY2_9ZZZZ
MHTKMHTKYERRSASLAIAGFADLVPRVRIPGVSYNISDLALKTMHTNAYEWFECIRDAYKNGENMENYEGWDPHPTRKNIYIDQETGLLYKRMKNSFERIPQKMTEHQECEEFRKSIGIVSMTSRSRGKGVLPADPAPDESHT